jgi:hypothetical protein
MREVEMRVVLAVLVGGVAAALATFLWMFFGKHAPPTIVPAVAAAGSAMLVINIGKTTRR